MVGPTLISRSEGSRTSEGEKLQDQRPKSSRTVREFPRRRFASFSVVRRSRFLEKQSARTFGKFHPRLRDWKIFVKGVRKTIPGWSYIMLVIRPSLTNFCDFAILTNRSPKFSRLARGQLRVKFLEPSGAVISWAGIPVKTLEQNLRLGYISSLSHDVRWIIQFANFIYDWNYDKKYLKLKRKHCLEIAAGWHQHKLTSNWVHI